MFSQNGEDILMLNIVNMLGRDEWPKTYFDLGCHHPIECSNTFLFYLRGWRGVAVDANEAFKPLWAATRSEDLWVNAALASRSGDDVTFYKFDEFSGRNTTSLQAAEAFQETTSLRVQDRVTMPAQSLADLSAVSGFCQWPTILSCDLEGRDYEVLEAAPFQALTITLPRILCVEASGGKNDTQMSTMLFEKGFARYCRMGENVIYVDRLIRSFL